MVDRGTKSEAGDSQAGRGGLRFWPAHLGGWPIRLALLGFIGLITGALLRLTLSGLAMATICSLLALATGYAAHRRRLLDEASKGGVALAAIQLIFYVWLWALTAALRRLL